MFNYLMNNFFLFQIEIKIKLNVAFLNSNIAIIFEFNKSKEKYGKNISTNFCELK